MRLTPDIRLYMFNSLRALDVRETYHFFVFVFTRIYENEVG